MYGGVEKRVAQVRWSSASGTGKKQKKKVCGIALRFFSKGNCLSPTLSGWYGIGTKKQGFLIIIIPLLPFALELVWLLEQERCLYRMCGWTYSVNQPTNTLLTGMCTVVVVGGLVSDSVVVGRVVEFSALEMQTHSA